MTRERIELTGQDESTASGATRKGSSARTINLPDDFKTAHGASNDADGLPHDGLQSEALQDEDARFLRTEKRIPVRRGPLGRKTANRLKSAITLALAVALAGGAAAAAYGYCARNGLLTIASSDNIEIAGVHNVSRQQVVDVVGRDLGINVFFVPLDERRMQLEKLPWVESATVMRLLPDRVAVTIVERTPVAFVQIGAKVQLIDAAGVVLGPSASRQARYSFPVIRGITESEPLSVRATTMKIYNRLVGELASGNYLQQLSEVDLSDPEDVKVMSNDAGGTVLIHLGASDFLERYKLYATHIAEWRGQFPRVQSVDMRYDGQIVVNQDIENPGDRPGAAKAGALGDIDGHPTTRPATLGTPKDQKAALPKESRKTHRKSTSKSQKPRAKSKAASGAKQLVTYGKEPGVSS